MNFPNLKTLLSFSCLLIASSSMAQKLPEVQTASVWAPANIAVDGNTAEWNDKFQAFNKTANVYYTISNNEDHLFLTIQATDHTIINKIVAGGLTFTIQKSGKRNDKNAMSIIYPYFTKKNRPYFNIKDETKLSPTLKDSIAKSDNKQLTYLMKTIRVNIPGVDTLITVANENDIKVAESFSNKLVFTWELSIGLKQLGISDGAKFSYHISIGDLVIKTLSKQSEVDYAPDVAGYSNNAAIPTYDFWGDYTLAKKQ